MGTRKNEVFLLVFAGLADKFLFKLFERPLNSTLFRTITFPLSENSNQCSNEFSIKYKYTRNSKKDLKLACSLSLWSIRLIKQLALILDKKRGVKTFPPPALPILQTFTLRLLSYPSSFFVALFFIPWKHLISAFACPLQDIRCHHSNSLLLCFPSY